MSFSPDKALVKSRYFELSKKYHPDFVSNGGEAEKEEALEMSSQINKAYKIFNKEDETISYTLQLKGVLQTDEKYDLPKDFLMEMMELNEALMEARMEDDEEKKAKLVGGIRNWELVIKNDIENIITAATVENITQADMLKVKDYYFKKKYLNRILDSLK